jgi:hypothetical protein
LKTVFYRPEIEAQQSLFGLKDVLKALKFDVSHKFETPKNAAYSAAFARACSFVV